MPQADHATQSQDPNAYAKGDHPRVALAHDWLCGFRGGEAVLERVAQLFADDDTPVYTMFDDGRKLSPRIDQLKHRVSGIARLPGASGRLRRWLMPLYPSAVGQLSRRLARDQRRRKIDLLISTSSAAIKSLRPPPGVPHLCYCHAPARYVWDQSDEYARISGPGDAVRAIGLHAIGPAYRRWDRGAAIRVTQFLANSTHTAEQIARCYEREAAVVFPPVDTDFFTPDPSLQRRDFWLVVSALEPYKRVDLAIAAAEQAGVQLIVAGAGSQRARLAKLAGSGVQFAGQLPRERLRHLYRTAALLVFPQVEDFGIAAAEALACGCPVVARAAGGALDIVHNGRTGAFFQHPTVRDIVEAAGHVPVDAWNACRESAMRFSVARFDQAMRVHARDLLERSG